MFHEGMFIVDDFEYRILSCKISIPGPKITEVGFILAPPPAPSFTVKIESRKETNLLCWIHKMQIKQYAQLKFTPAVEDGRSRTFDLYDVRCVSNYEDFGKDGEVPLTNTLKLIPAILVADGVLLRVQNWKIQNPDIIMGKIKPKEITRSGQEEKETKVTNQYVTDLDGNQNPAYKMGDHIYVVIESQNMIGEEIDVKVPEKKADFLYKGKRLENDMIKNYIIADDIDKIPLQVIPEDHKDL